MSAIHQLLDVDGLFGGGSNLLIDSKIVFGVDNYAVEPVHDAKLADSAKDTNVGAVDFRKNFRDFVFDQSIKIGRLGRLLEKIHSNFPRLVSHPLPSLRRSSDETMAPSGSTHKENLATRTPYKGGGRVPVESSFSSRNRAYVHFRLIADSFSTPRAEPCT